MFIANYKLNYNYFCACLPFLRYIYTIFCLSIIITVLMRYVEINKGKDNQDNVEKCPGGGMGSAGTDISSISEQPLS